MDKPAIIGGIAALLLVVAVGDHPYGYYTFLRWATTCAAIWLAVIASQNNKESWLLFLIPTALLFNPLVPVFLTKETWTPINLLVAVGMFLTGKQLTTSTRNAETRV